VEELDEGTLVAFVDGELDAATAREVVRRIAEDPEVREKVRLLRGSALLIRAAFSGPAWEEVPPRLSRLVAQPRARWLARGPAPRPAQRPQIGRRQYGMAIAASLAACVAGIAGGLGIRDFLTPEPSPTARLLDEVAEYHAVYARDSRGFEIVPASAAPRIKTWFADLLGRQLSIPDLAVFGFDFRGARLLVIDGSPVAQFLYVERGAPPGASRHPLGVCVTAWPGDDEPLTTARRSGVDLALWTHGGFAYVLVGWLHPAELSQIAIAIRSTLETT
jgi:anti-sigma factor RsiW